MGSKEDGKLTTSMDVDKILKDWKTEYPGLLKKIEPYITPITGPRVADGKEWFPADKIDIPNILPAKAPGKPTVKDGYVPPKKWDGKLVKNPNGPGYGYPDNRGRVWIPTGEAGSLPGTTGPAHGGPHWDIEDPKSPGKYENVYPKFKKGCSYE